MTFGQGDMGQLGLGEDIAERKKPAPVSGELEGKKVVQIVCGGMHTVALTDDGQVSDKERKTCTRDLQSLMCCRCILH